MPRALRGIAGGGRFPAAYWTQPPRPVPFPGFGKGLVLRDQPDALPPDAAVDCLDVDLTERGALRQRDGYTHLTSSTLTNRVDSLFAAYFSSGTRQLLAGCGTRLEALSTAGAVVASQTGLAGGPYGFARYGQPNTEVVYAGNGTDTLQKWSGAAWSAPTATVDSVAGRAMPKAGALAVWATSNRLVASGYATTTGGPNGATSSPSHVYFSEAGNPEAWLTNNYVQLSPGDGEAIQAVVAYGNSIYVFKSSKFYRFFGASTDSAGQPVFNYQTVDTGIGLASPRGVCVGRDGVYFLGRAGVYRTTGGAPELVSGPLDPLFVGGQAPFYTGSRLSHANITNAALGWHEERLYLAIPTAGSTNDRLFVFDPRFGWWVPWSIPASALASFRIGSQAELVFGYATGSNHVGRYSSSYVTDDGANVNGTWLAAWWDMGDPVEKRMRYFKVWGSGKLQAGFATDFSTSPAQLGALDFTTGADLFADGTNASDLFADGTNSSDLFAAGVVLSPRLVNLSCSGTVMALNVTGYQGQSWVLERVTPLMMPPMNASRIA